MNEITAIPTTYAGIAMRSRFEAQAALLFDVCGIKWEYEPFSVMLGNGVAYRPDFVLPELYTVVECRGYESEKGELQIQGFARELESHGYKRYAVIGTGESAGVYTSKRAYIPDIRIVYCQACDRFDFLGVNSCSVGHCIDCGWIVSAADGKILVGGLPAETWRAQEVFDKGAALVFQKRLALARLFELQGRCDLSAWIHDAAGEVEIEERASAICAG